MDKGPFINEIRDGQAVAGLFLIKEMNLAETRNGKPYLILKVMDRTGELDGRLWEDAEKQAAEGGTGKVVYLRGQAQNYKGQTQLKIDTIRSQAEDEVDYSLFLPTGPGNIEAMAGELVTLAGSVADPSLRKLLLAFFRPGDFFDAFRKAPAAKNLHHAYLGGLLEHTLAVSRLADSLATAYPRLDRSLLLAGALLHDVGKVEEFDYTNYPFAYTERGRLVGHLVIGVEMVQARVAAIKNFPADLAGRLKHLILSHHGRYEYGSPTLPMMAEAFVLHFLDDLDAKLNLIDKLSGQAAEPGYQWTDFQRTLERFLFIRGGPAPAAGEGEGGTRNRRETDSRQQSLF